MAAASPAEFVSRPGLIWGFDIVGGVAFPLDEHHVGDPRPKAGLRWLHFNLSDSRTERWIATASPTPQRIRDLFLSGDDHQRHVLADGVLGAILHDVRHDFLETDTSIAAVRFAVAPGLMVTARHHPTRCGDVVKQRLAEGVPPADAAAALELLFASLSEVQRFVVAELDDRVQAMEDDLLKDRGATDAKAFLTTRSLIVRLHRAFGGARTTLHRIEHDIAAPPDLVPPVVRLAERTAGMTGELLAIQGQLKLIREEQDLQATQRTNQTLYVLSVLSALLLPATLITGLFGMNTGGFPWAQHPHGTVFATLLAVGSSAAVYVGLRFAGYLRR